MKFSNAKQIVAMMLVWGLTLSVYDRLFNKHLFAPKADAITTFTKPQVRMWVNHLCCSGCFANVNEAIKTLPWLGRPSVVKEEKLLSKKEANSTEPRSSYGGGVIVDLQDVSKADFVAMNDALRKQGMGPGEIEFGGIPHFALKIEVSRHLCCHSCVQAVQEAMTPKQDPKFISTLQWLDSARVDQVAKTITAYVKVGYAADVGELMRALDQAGFPPSSIRIAVGE